MDSSQYSQFKEGIRLFNERQYYEAHEAWEVIWLKEAGDDKLFLQGLIQLAASCLKKARGLQREAGIARERALAKLSTYSVIHHHIHLHKLCLDAENLAADLKQFPKIEFSFSEK